MLPGLIAVLAQPQRVVARHLLTPNEINNRTSLVNIMLDYAITFAMGRQLETAESASDIVLAPPVHRVTFFEVLPSSC